MKRIIELVNFVALIIIIIFGILFILLDKDMLSDRQVLYLIFLLTHTAYIDVSFEIQKLNKN